MRKLPLHPGARGLEDDCAVLEIGDETLVITHDMMAERIHFREDANLADVAWKLVAVNLSDLAAKGAKPVGLVLGHTLGEDDTRFLKGFEEALKAFETPLLGGDTIGSDSIRTFGLTAIGRATHTPVPARSEAQPGDAIYVTGMLGRALLGFEGAAQHLSSFNRPKPLLAEGRALAPHVHAMMDVSDGLLLDCWRMAFASGVSFQLEHDLIPVADPARFDECVRWGDDYQLLFTAAPGTAPPVPATRIGTVAASDHPSLTLDRENITDRQDLGYRHR